MLDSEIEKAVKELKKADEEEEKSNKEVAPESET